MGDDATHARAAQQVFGARAASCTTSATHTDPVVLARVVELAEVQPGARCLDVGTGTGHTAFALAPRAGWVLGIDLTPEMLAEGRKLRTRNGLLNVDFAIGDAEALPLPDASFEIVACRRAAHHFTDIRRALREMRRALKPGGRLVIDDRAAPDDDALDALVNHLDTLHDRSHIREYRPAEWVALLEEAGFRVDAVEPYMQHRHISSYTERATPEDARAVYATLESLSAPLRAALDLREVNGALHLNHWYVMLAATAPAPARGGIEDAWQVRRMREGEEGAVSALVRRVFDMFVAGEYAPEGVAEFLTYIAPERIAARRLAGCDVLVAEAGPASAASGEAGLVGVLEMRDCEHISLLFVEGMWQGRGLARDLLDEAIRLARQRRPDLRAITVNASPNSTYIYTRLGFVATGPERTERGIRYTPMRLDLPTAAG